MDAPENIRVKINEDGHIIDGGKEFDMLLHIWNIYNETNVTGFL